MLPLKLGTKYPDLKILKVGYLPATHDTLLFVALYEDFFSHYGLKVEARKYSNSPEVLEGLAAAEVDVAIPGIAAPIYKMAGGADLKIVGGEAWYSAGVVAPKTTPISTGTTASELLAPLVGKKIATIKQSTGEAVFMSAINQAQLSGRIELVGYKKPENALEAVRSGAVDAALLWSPHMGSAVEQSNGDLHICLWTSQLQDHPCCRQVSTTEGTKARKDEIVRYLSGIIAAKCFMQDSKNHEDVIKAVQKYTKGYSAELLQRELFQATDHPGVNHRSTEVSPGNSRDELLSYLEMMEDARLISHESKESIAKNGHENAMLVEAYQNVFPDLSQEQASECANAGLNFPDFLANHECYLGAPPE